MLKFMLAAAAASLSACSMVGTPIAERVAPVIAEYCAREPYPARQFYRQMINAELATEGHRVSVDCAGDPAEE